MADKQHRPVQMTMPPEEQCMVAPEARSTGPAPQAPRGNAARQEALRNRRKTSRKNTKGALDKTVLGTRVGASGLSFLPQLAKGGDALLKGSAATLMAPLSFASHILDEDQVAQSKGGQAVTAGVKTGLSLATDIGAAAAGGVPAAAAAFEAKHNIQGGVDAAGAAYEAVAGRSSAAFRKGEQLEDHTAKGKYGVIPQAVGMATQGMDKYTDKAAATGERGMLLAMASWLSGSSPVAESHTESHEEVWKRGTTQEILDGRPEGEVEWQDTRTVADHIAEIKAMLDGADKQ